MFRKLGSLEFLQLNVDSLVLHLCRCRLQLQVEVHDILGFLAGSGSINLLTSLEQP